MTGLQQTWVYLQSTPLLWLTLTLLAYQGAEALYRRSGGFPLCNPVLLSVAVLVGLLVLSGTPYSAYFSGAQFVHFLLGPATVALAVPLYRQVAAIRMAALPILVTLVCGSLVAIIAAMGIGWALGGSRTLLLSLAPKSATTPIAMGISEHIGGIPSLTAVLVISSGIAGAAFGGWVLDRLRVRDDMARGMAMGVASHGLGTARAMQMSPAAGAFSGLAMGLNGLATAILVPLVISLLF
jgi:predicted murein hydrolase (TIGR00659 family)